MTPSIQPKTENHGTPTCHTVLITGAAGFLGRHLCEYFLKRGDRVIAWDNLSSGREENLDELLRHIDYKNRFSLKILDVCDSVAVAENEGSDAIKYILHFACLASPKWYQKDPLGTLQVGSWGAWNMLALAKRKGARILFASTSEVYGDPPKDRHPQRETYYGNANPIGIRSMYDEAKRFQEALAVAYHRQDRELQIRIARIFNTYGPYMRTDDQRVVTEFIKNALQGKPLSIYGGTQTRSLCYVSDLVEGLAALLEADEPSYALGEGKLEEEVMQDVRLPVNLGNSKTLISMQELAELIIRLTGSQSKIIHLPSQSDDPERRQPNTQKAKNLLGGWEAKVTIEEGLKRTIDYVRNELGRMEQNS